MIKIGDKVKVRPRESVDHTLFPSYLSEMNEHSGKECTVTSAWESKDYDDNIIILVQLQGLDYNWRSEWLRNLMEVHFEEGLFVL